MGEVRGDRAVVIGSGMGGLFAARVLSDHVREVVVLERDPEPGVAPRRGVPQGHHLHGLMPGGFDAMCDWFPGFADRLERAGGLPSVLGRDMRFYIDGGASYSPVALDTTPADGPRVFASSRPFLEHCVRTEVAALTNVGFRYGCSVEEPVVVDGRVAGVHTGDGQRIEADLVVDTSGRHPVTLRWLEQLGYDQPAEEHVDCDLHYVSVTVEPPDVDAFEGTSIAVMPTGRGPAGWRLGYIAKQEGRRWIVGISGRYDDVPPTDWDAFVAYGRELEHDVWAELVAPTRPLGRLMPYRLPRSVRRRFDRLDRFPDGLLPLGDAVCFVNPIYGQGMSAAAGQCRGLADVLARRPARSGLAGLAAEVLPVAADWVRAAWVLSALADLAHPACTGDQPVEELDDFAILDGLDARAGTEPEVAQTIGDVYLLRRPLSAVRAFA